MIKFLTFADPKSVDKKHPEGIQQEYPIRVSYYALKMLKEELGRGLLPTDDGTDYAAYECLLFYALKKGHQKVTPEVDFPFTKDQMEDVMDEVYFDFMKIVPEFFSDETLEPKQILKRKVTGEKK
jgi:hypothetical protein